MKIGILTYHCSHNYGAFLQSYALVNVLRQETMHDVEIIDFNMAVAAKMNKNVINFNRRNPESLLYNYKKYRMFIDSKKKYLPVSQIHCVSDDLGVFRDFLTNQYDAIIVGSDEVWKLDGFRGFPNPYWLPDLKGVMKISYAASSRTRIEKVSEDNRKLLERYIGEFKYIGVRDDITKQLISNVCKPEQEIHMNCDPTFAYNFDIDPDRGKWILNKRFHVNTQKKCIGIMCGVPSLAKNILEDNCKECQFVSLYYYYRQTKGFAVIDPFEWIDVIAALDGLITTFFHGMVFAVKTDTPFLVIENRELEDVHDSKNYDILNRNGLSGNFVCLNTNADVLQRTTQFVNEVKNEKYSVHYDEMRNAERALFEPFIDFIVQI